MSFLCCVDDVIRRLFIVHTPSGSATGLPTQSDERNDIRVRELTNYMFSGWLGRRVIPRRHFELHFRDISSIQMNRTPFYCFSRPWYHLTRTELMCGT